MSRNEITDLLFEELDKYGLKGEIEERGKHLGFVYTLPDGQRRMTVVPRTTSDWRSGLNARSDLRKMLRVDNVPLKQESIFAKAMSLPKQSIVTQVQREFAIQKDVEVLAEVVLELQEQNSVLMQQMALMLEKMNSITVVSTVMSNISFSGQKVVEQPVLQPKVEMKPLEHGDRVSSNEVVLNCVGFEWTPTSEILKSAKNLNKAVVNQCLMRLRRHGLVENGQRGWWRKVPNDNVVVLGSGNQSAS